MRTQWIGKDVDIELLSKSIEDFLLKRAFKIKKEKIEESYVIFGVPSDLRMKRRLTINITGKPDDFVVEFVSPYSGVATKMTGLAAMFGFGGFLLQRLKSKEYFEKLERNFWFYMEERMIDLVGSAEHGH